MHDELKDFRAERDDASFALMSPDVAAALIIAALVVLVIADRTL